MSEEGPEEAPRGSSRQNAPTIDLKATEVTGAAERDPTGGSSESPAEPAPSSESAEADRPQSKAGRPWAPAGAGAVAGGVVAAGMMAAAVFFSRDFQDNGLAGRLSRIEQQVQQQSDAARVAGGDTGTLDDVAARVGKLEVAVAAIRASAADPEAANRISSLEGEVKSLAERVGIAARRSDEAAAAARDATQRADAVSASLTRIEQKIATTVADPAAVQALTNRVASLEQAQKALETELAKRADALGYDAAGRFAIAAAALDAALERGGSFRQEISTVRPFVPDAKQLAELEPFADTGVPPTTTLAEELSHLIPSLRRASGAPAASEDSFLHRLQANAEKLVRIRSLNEATGDDPGAIVSRIEIDASKADLNAALAELAKLQPAMRAPAQGWIEKAERRSAALAAGRQLVAQSLAGLKR